MIKKLVLFTCKNQTGYGYLTYVNLSIVQNKKMTDHNRPDGRESET